MIDTRPAVLGFVIIALAFTFASFLTGMMMDEGQRIVSQVTGVR